MGFDPSGNGRAGLTAAEVAALGEKEALRRLELLASTSRILDATLAEYDQAVAQVADACVPDFADLCAIEVVAPAGNVTAAAYRYSSPSGLVIPDEWTPVGRLVTADRNPILAYPGPHEPDRARRVREQIGAQSLIVAPITGGGLTLGWFVAATGDRRRGFRPSALRIGTELASRLGTAMQRALLHVEMQASVRDQSRTVRRLRRLATAATNLAGAPTTQSVLDIACIEACVIQEADGAMARWAMADGTLVTARAGKVNHAFTEEAFEAAAGGQSSRGPGWIAYPLPSSDPWQHAALVVFVSEDLSSDEELVLSSLASLIPVAFERAIGTEAALGHEARLRAVVEASPVALVALAADGAVTTANRAALDLFGWDPDPVQWILDGSLRAQFARLAVEVLETNTTITVPVTIDSRELSLSGGPMPAVSRSEQPSVIIAGVDLTEIRRAEHALVQAQRMEAMGQVAGRVAHDFNNLLTLIMGYAEILRRTVEGDAHEPHIDAIVGASKRAAALTQQMLGMTRQRVNSGVVIDLGREVMGLDSVLGRVVGAQISLGIRTSPELIKVRFDPSEMEQIVVNLVINACDAMDGVGAVEVTVEASAPAPNDRLSLDLPAGPLVLLTVADNGPGMGPEVKARCLEPFFTTKEKGHGSGLGLPTVYGLVKDGGGQLHIDSAPGGGTIIRIWLPISLDSTSVVGVGPSESWPTTERLSGRILLVEDENDLRQMATAILGDIGLDLVTAGSAEQALGLLESEGPFDAVITDVILPGLSGVDLEAQARRIQPEVRVLFMTGYTGAVGTRGLDLDAPVLHKPYRPDALRRRVADLLRSRADDVSNA